MRIPLLRGRNIAESDSDVLLVSREAAKLDPGNPTIPSAGAPHFR